MEQFFRNMKKNGFYKFCQDFFRPKIKNACKQLNKETRALEDRDTYSKAFLQTMNLWTQDPVVKSFVNPILN